MYCDVVVFELWEMHCIVMYYCILMLRDVLVYICTPASLVYCGIETININRTVIIEIYALRKVK